MLSIPSCQTGRKMLQYKHHISWNCKRDMMQKLIKTESTSNFCPLLNLWVKIPVNSSSLTQQSFEFLFGKSGFVPVWCWDGYLDHAITSAAAVIVTTNPSILVNSAVWTTMNIIKLHIQCNKVHKIQLSSLPILVLKWRTCKNIQVNMKRVTKLICWTPWLQNMIS